MLNIRCMWNVGVMASILITSFVSGNNVPPPTGCSLTVSYALLLHLTCVVCADWSVCSVAWLGSTLELKKTFLYPISKDLQLWYSEAVVFLINLAALWSMEISLQNISSFHSTLRIFLQVSLKKEGNIIVVSTTDII